MLALPSTEVHVWVVRGGVTAAREALPIVLGRYLGRAPLSLRFASTALGKPHLVGETGIRFNLSHAKSTALIAVARREVGVDVEEPRRIAYEAGVARRIMTPEELAAYEATPEDGRTAVLLRTWVRKEALVKAIGVGLRRPLRDVPSGSAAPLRIVDLDIAGCTAAVAADGGDWVPVVREFTDG